MRLLVSAGATGGGINPALSALQALDEKPESVLWLGSTQGLDADLVSRAGYPFKSVPGAAVHGVGLKALWGLFQLGLGYFAALKHIRKFKPDVLFFTGGYTAIPTGLAGRRIPTLVCLPDIEPGLALKVISRFADHVAVPVEDSKAYFPPDKPVTVTGYPTRIGLAEWEREKAFEAFELSPDKPTLLVTGGSSGARSINRAVLAILPELLAEMQVIHLTGSLTWPEAEAAQEKLTSSLKENYRAYPYLYEKMGAAYTAADLAVMRAGASILGELPLFGLPAILVPYPHAWRYQKVNADYLVKRGAAVVLKDEDLSRDLSATVRELMHNKSKRSQMQAAMQSLADPDAAAKIANLLKKLARPNSGQVG